MNFTPLLTSKAGSCLTVANWQEIGINTATYYLDALLMRPGLSFLMDLTTLRSYCRWPGVIVLNALLPATRDGLYAVRSCYDGAIIQVTSEILITLINNLQPDIVLLPPGFASQFAQALSSTQMILIPANENPQFSPTCACGTYLIYDKQACLADFRQTINMQKPTYLVGAFTVNDINQLAKEKTSFLIESDKPASDGLLGIAYSREGEIALLSNELAHQHEVIDKNCLCPVCKQGLTCAYLRHLLLQTPLLGQRFLIQHNAYFYQQITNLTMSSFT